MYVRKVMTSPAISVTPGTPVKHAAAQLAQNGFTSMPVLDITADIVRRLHQCPGYGHWEVAVAAGNVTLTGSEPDPVNRRTAQLIAEAVIGTTAVRFCDPAVAG